MKKFFKTMTALALTVAVLAGNSIPALAANQEVQTSGTETATVELTLNVKSAYCVSLPATIELEYAVVEVPEGEILWNGATQITGRAELYQCKIEIGVAGKIPSGIISVAPVLPCELTNEDDNVVPLNALDSSESLGNTYPQYISDWTKDEIGTCDFDGATLTNCVYEKRYLSIGTLANVIQQGGSYTGSLVFNFSMIQ